MENPDQKLEQLRQQYPIMKGALMLGFQFTPRSSSVAVRCYNHEDRSPSLVLQPETSSYECKSCGEHGDIFTLIQKVKKCDFPSAVKFLDPNFYPDKKSERPQDINKDEYWNSHGFTEEDKEKYRLRITDEGLDILLPNGSIKRRNFKPYFDKQSDEWKFPKFRFVVKNGKCLYKVGDKSDVIFLLEGETKAIKLHKETGFTAISDTTGAASFDPSYLNDPHISEAKKIYIIPDNDKPGRDGALKTAKILGLDRCFQITLPQGKDINEYFVNHNRTGEHFKSLIADAVPMQSLHNQQVSEYVESSLDFSKMTEEDVLKTEVFELLRFGIPKMDTGDRAVGIPPGFIIFASSQGVGKSWMMLHLTRVFYLNHGKRSVIISLEMSKEALKERALQAYNHLTQEQYKNGADLSEGINFLTKICKPIIQEFGLDDSGKITTEELTNIVDYWYSQGIRVFQFDHIHQISGMSDGQREKEVSDKWSWAIKNLVDKYKDIWFIAYAQTNKNAAKRPATKDDIRYGALFVDKCDMVFTLNNPAAMIEAKKAANQNLEEIYNPPTNRQIFIYLSKARKLSIGLKGWLLFHSRTGNFTQNEDADVRPSSSLQYSRKPKTFAPLPDFTKPPPEAPKTAESKPMEETEELPL